MRSLHSLFISAIPHCAYYYLHPSSAGCMTRGSRMHREYDLAFLSVKRACIFFFGVSVRPRVTGCNVTRATRHMHSRARALFRVAMRSSGFNCSVRRILENFSPARTCVRVIRTRVNNARPSINSILIYDGADSWFVISCSLLLATPGTIIRY